MRQSSEFSPHRPGSADPRSPYYDDPLYGHPWQTPEHAEAKRRKRHALWIRSLSDGDWERISDLVDATSALDGPVRLEDLDGMIHVGTRMIGSIGGTSGERFGTMRGRELLAWTK